MIYQKNQQILENEVTYQIYLSRKPVFKNNPPPKNATCKSIFLIDLKKRRPKLLLKSKMSTMDINTWSTCGKVLSVRIYYKYHLKPYSEINKALVELVQRRRQTRHLDWTITWWKCVFPLCDGQKFTFSEPTGVCFRKQVMRELWDEGNLTSRKGVESRNRGNWYLESVAIATDSVNITWGSRFCSTYCEFLSSCLHKAEKGLISSDTQSYNEHFGDVWTMTGPVIDWRGCTG